MKLEIGICSYRNPEKLRLALGSIYDHTRTPFNLQIWHNDSNDKEGEEAWRICERFAEDDRCFITRNANVGYAGAVNGLIAASTAPYFAYMDNDVEVLTPGWDERFIEVLEANPECGQVFPGAGHYGFHNGRYHECLWNAGYCWMVRRESIEVMRRFEHPGSASTLDRMEYRPMDTSLGHHEEVDLMIRLRLAGFQIGCVPDVQVLHHETATSSPESAKRIHRGVVNWMNRWNRYFVGDAIKYPNPDPDSGEGYDPRTLRFTDWPPCALYLERWTLAQFPEWNASPREVQTSAGPMDAVEILKPSGCYKGRAI